VYPSVRITYLIHPIISLEDCIVNAQIILVSKLKKTYCLLHCKYHSLMRLKLLFFLIVKTSNINVKI
jgi:hypothetical protein